MIKQATLAHSAPQLLAQARAKTGIDIVDADIAEPLEKFVHALNTEAQLHEAGAREMEGLVLLVLTNRLRMLRDFREHPEIAEQRIESPLILSGAGRTGSTKLHKMLAASGDFKWLPCWQGISLSPLTGDRREDPAERIHVAAKHIDWFNEHAPNAKLIHEFSTFEPEEENLILAHLLFGAYMQAFLYVPQYLQWYMTARDLQPDFAFLKRGLQYLQWQFHDGDPRPWLLKNPIWPGFEPLLAEVFPGAVFVSTHREPISTLTSSVSLMDNYHVAYSPIDRKKIIGPMMLANLSYARDVQVATHEAHPELRPLDIAYRDTTKNAERVVEQIYAHAGMTLSDPARQAMREWEHINAQHKHGVHRYELEDFALSLDAAEKCFTRYSARYGAYF